MPMDACQWIYGCEAGGGAVTTAGRRLLRVLLLLGSALPAKAGAGDPLCQAGRLSALARDLYSEGRSVGAPYLLVGSSSQWGRVEGDTARG